jgi:hypothetical protein
LIARNAAHLNARLSVASPANQRALCIADHRRRTRRRPSEIRMRICPPTTPTPFRRSRHRPWGARWRVLRFGLCGGLGDRSCARRRLDQQKILHPFISRYRRSPTPTNARFGCHGSKCNKAILEISARSSLPRWFVEPLRFRHSRNLEELVFQAPVGSWRVVPAAPITRGLAAGLVASDEHRARGRRPHHHAPGRNGSNRARYFAPEHRAQAAARAARVSPVHITAVEVSDAA